MTTQTLIERLRTEPMLDGMTLGNEAADALEAQAAEIAALKADAERYKWLFSDVTLKEIRDACDTNRPLSPTHSDVLNEIMGFCITKERADSIIDAAMKESK
jgi:hypothetical protein